MLAEKMPLGAKKGLIFGAVVGSNIAVCLGFLFAAPASAAPPTLTLTATDAIVGQAIHSTAQLSESPEASGEISFEIFGPDDPTCLGPALTPAPASATATGEGAYDSGDFTSSQAGTYHWRAHYSGNPEVPEDLPTDSACVAISTVAKASPGLAGSAGASVVGAAIHDEATVAGGFSPSGEVTFSVFGPGDASCSTALATVAVPIQSGQATSSDFFPQQAGAFRWMATYSGDANNEPASTTCGASGQTSAVAKASPTLSGVATSATVGSSITDSATLAAGFGVGGKLVFRAYGPGDSTCSTPEYEEEVTVSGNGTYSPPGFLPAAAGAYRWTVEYEGDPNNDAVATPCGASGQTSAVAKASPTLSGVATSATVGSSITDSATISAGFEVGGQLVFRAFGPGDGTCANAPKYQATVPVNGNGTYSPPGFKPAPGLYQWTVEYGGDANNEAVGSACGAANQGSAVGTIAVTLGAGATGSIVGNPVTATATIKEGAIPGGQITFKAFAPGDTSCSAAPVFTSTVNAAGNGSYPSAAFVPTRIGTFRWTVSYSGDPNHAPAGVACSGAVSTIAQAKPSIASGVSGRLRVGTAFRITATLTGAYVPGGTVSFRIYAPGATDCSKPLSIDTVAVTGAGAVRSDPFVPHGTGRYSFLATYSGDAANQAAIEGCDLTTHLAQVSKRAPKLKPRARLKGKRILIGARLSGAVTPVGMISFRLYRPGDKRCKGRPAFSGGVSVRSNGDYLLAQYLATKPGTYRLSVGYSGDTRNQKYKGDCRGAQPIHIG